MGNFIKSEIAAFDTLLGDGIAPGSIVLLRGVRGTGKTTLALQLANRYAEKNDVTYISLETDPKILKNNLAKNYNLKEAENASIDGSLPTNGSRFELISREDIVNIAGNLTIPTDDPKAKTSMLLKLAYSISEGKRIYFIDSLNALLDFSIGKMLSVNDTDENSSSRTAFIDFYEEIRKNSTPEFILFLIGEGDSSGAASIISESYFCDVEIELNRENILSERGFEHRKSEIQKHTSEEIIPVYREHTEKRNFIRVIKSRCTPSQGRRCAYDFKKGEGLKFYETYPGDGLITLFAENAPQLNEWQDFLAEDVMEHSSYPALDFGVFGRRSLRRAFSSMRRYFYIPDRTDMHLGSFDSYWSTWYQQFFERVRLKELVKEIGCKNPNPKNDGESKEDYRERLKNTEMRFRKIIGELHLCYCKYKKSGESNYAKTMIENLYNEFCRFCDKSNQICKDKETMRDFVIIKFTSLAAEQKTGGLLEKLPFDKLRLFGELRSDFIKELPLMKLKKDEGESNDEHEYDSIPYNANVGLMVYRKDLLKTVLSEFKENKRYVGKFKRELEYLIVDVEEKWLKVSNVAENNKAEKRDEVMKKAKAIADFASGRLDKDYIPKTWEEIFVLCQGDDKNNRLMLMETRTNASLMCTFLEFFWSYGDKLNINIDASYKFEDEDKVKEAVFKALYMMSLFFNEELTPRNSTLGAKEFSLRNADKDNWLFARHWFSTFVDILTAKDNEGNFLWDESKSIDLGIMNIPVAYSSLFGVIDLETLDTSKLKDIVDEPAHHHSCWGEWSFGLFHGSENKELAIDLINNVMNSTNVLDRAKSCAAVPTVKDFYEIHGDLECFNIPFSDNINISSKFSYDDLRKKYLAYANTRTTIFDYHHCASEFTALVEYVRSSKDLKAENLIEKINNAFGRIKDYNLKDMLSW